jgi:uncharacterized protein (DUF2132 family)
MSREQPNNPLHGITLKAMLEQLVERRGWEDLGARIKIRCFTHDPSLTSSLKFLRKTEWARSRVEALFLEDLRRDERKRERNQDRAARRAYRAEREAADGEPDSEEPGQAV